MLPSHKWTPIIVVGLLIGCATPPSTEPAKPTVTATVAQKPAPAPATAPAPVMQTPRPAQPAPAAAVEPSTSEKNLVIALASFERGAYAVAMRQLSPLTNDTSLDVPKRLRAIKALAFSQCLTRAVIACRNTFERAFKLDPAFSLAPAEQGHPVWGPQFELARKNLKGK